MSEKGELGEVHDTCLECGKPSKLALCDECYSPKQTAEREAFEKFAVKKYPSIKRHPERPDEYNDWEVEDAWAAYEAGWQARAESPADHIKLEVFQQDWTPGFAAFRDDGKINETAKAHITLDLGTLLNIVESGDLPAKDLPYMVAETIMHEVIHALESWAKVEFSEERVEALLEQYRRKYRLDPDEAHWQYDPTISKGTSEHPKAHDLRTCPAMRALEHLTVGGSEFVDDIPRCVKYIRDKQEALQDVAKNAVKARQELHPKALPSQPVHADTLFGVWWGADMDAYCKEFGGVIQWDNWQRLADWLNERGKAALPSQPADGFCRRIDALATKYANRAIERGGDSDVLVSVCPSWIHGCIQEALLEFSGHKYSDEETAAIPSQPDVETISFCAAPCGHSSQYCYTSDGGKHIICLICEVERLTLRPIGETKAIPSQQAIERAARRIAELVAEMRGEVKSKTLPVVHDAATAHWADRLEEILRSELGESEATQNPASKGSEPHERIR